MAREWVDKLVNGLKELGLSYEVEENVRIHIDDLVIQVSESGDGYTVTISVQLPPSEIDDVGRYVESYRKALEIVSKLSGEIVYELDTSLPDYPFLYISRRYSDPNKMIEELLSALRR